MRTTAEKAVELPHSDFELEALLPAEREQLLCGLAGQLQSSALCAGQDLGHMEEQLLRGGHELFRQMLKEGAQLKADQAPRLCPVCQHQLSRNICNIVDSEGLTLKSLQNLQHFGR